MTRTKVFVGNLSFKTNERDLAKEFEAAGKVASASIISRGNRSLGYGFVEMESEDEARKSVELLNKKLIDSREINVEIARPREEKPPADPSAPAPAGGAGGGGGGGAGGAGGERGGARGGRRPFRGRRPPRGPRGPKPEGDGAPAPAGGEGAPQRAPRQPRAPRPPRNDADKTPRTESQDTLFVTNLPFSVDDQGLANIFAGLNIKTAHVVRKHNDRSKGFGFVEFNNKEDQQKALAAIDKKPVDGRELVVKVALTEVARNAAGAPGAPGAPGSPAPAAGAPASPAAAASKKNAAAPGSPAPAGGANTTTTTTESK